MLRSELRPEDVKPPGTSARVRHPADDAPPMLRMVSALALVALVARLIASALPGSGSGMERWIDKAEGAASLFAQLTVLVGSSLLIMLTVSTRGSRHLGALYRILVVPPAAAMLLLVILASSMGLEPVLSLALGVSCLALSSAGASTALRSPSSRAPGLVLSLLTLGAAFRLMARLFATSLIVRSGTGGSAAAWIATIGSALDVLAIALTAARLRGEHGTPVRISLVGTFVLAGALSWEAVRGSLEGARTWQVVAARALGELSSGAGGIVSIGGRSTVDLIAVLVAAVVIAWPGRISAGSAAIALGLLARSGLDVPVSALLLALGALVAALGSGPGAEPSSPLTAGPVVRTPAPVDG